jgi:hypothetical protein
MQDRGLLLLCRFVVVVFELRSLSLRCRFRRFNRLGDVSISFRILPTSVSWKSNNFVISSRWLTANRKKSVVRFFCTASQFA